MRNINFFSSLEYNDYRLNNGSTVTQQHDAHYNNENNNLNIFSPNRSNYSGTLTGFSQTNSTSSAPIPEHSLYKNIKHQQQKEKQSNSSPDYTYDRPVTHIPSTSVANYQPYPGLISRANLKIMGDLDSMAKNWSTEEWENRRRLVQFWRKQNGNEIRCTFDPVAQSERSNTNSSQIMISCIYWAERNECYITSVDCIHLLESLMDTRFSVEEKNRVRRNLEGFRPITVSKCKAESADFFKLIMSFPNPKPRNIEKDVKVFPWKTLPYALKKIITKYTASSYGINGNQPQRCATIDHIASTTNNTATFMLPTASENTNNQQQHRHHQHPHQLQNHPIQNHQLQNHQLQNHQLQNHQHTQQSNTKPFYEDESNIYPSSQQFNSYQIQQQNEQSYQTASPARKYSSTYIQPEPNQIASSGTGSRNGINRSISMSPESIATTSAAIALDPNTLSNINGFENE